LATGRGLPRSLGHPAGVEALRRVVRLCDSYHIPMLTVYAFSTENWGRPQEEVGALMNLFWETVRSDVDQVHQNGVRLRHIGRLDGLSPDVRKAIAHMMTLTRDNTKLDLNVVSTTAGAPRLWMQCARLCQLACADETPRTSSGISTPATPDPDLIIRTGGEMRLSNYLVWQAAYAEYYSSLSSA
jgi:undecaprenyl diphosphate synthase